MEIGEELTTIQVSPDPFLSMVKDRRLLATFQAGKQKIGGETPSRPPSPIQHSMGTKFPGDFGTDPFLSSSIPASKGLSMRGIMA